MPAKSAYRWVPWIIAGALGVVVLANGALAYFAATSSTGLVTEHPYERGNGYNRILAAGDAQVVLGWHGTVRFVAREARHGDLVAELTGRDGQPLAGATVAARVMRPVEPVPPLGLALSEATAGQYIATTALDRPGQWEVAVTVTRDREIFAFTQRIIVK